jgi:uncharacterized integral membrane protein (TIGR00698 family)
MNPPKDAERDNSNWADHLIYMEAGSEPAIVEKTEQAESSIRVGVALCAVLAVGAGLAEVSASRLLGGRTLDAAMFAMLFGIAVGNLGINPALIQPGARWIARIVLPLGIVLLGARLQFSDLLGVGLKGLALSVGVICLSGAALYLAARLQKMPGRLATLLAVGNGICGGSAIVALAPVINAKQEEVAVSVSTVALLGLAGMLLLPGLGAALGMDPITFGTWSGLVIQQTPQVIATGFSHGTEAGAIAIVVKLVRISLLAPVVLLVGLTYRLRFEPNRSAGGTQFRGLIPSFIVGLLLLAGVASIGIFPNVTISFAEDSALGAVGTTLHTQSLAIGASKVCLVAGMAAVGLETRMETLRKTGPAALRAAALGSAVVVTATAIVLTLMAP